MDGNPVSPRIERSAWGRLETDDGSAYKDAKLFPGGSREWDWRETGTHHVPGIQPADVEELLDHGADTVVLSKGFWQALQVCPETLDMLKERGIDIHVLETGKAVDAYNELRISRRVGGLFQWLEWLWHYPATEQVDEDPAGGDG